MALVSVNEHLEAARSSHLHSTVCGRMSGLCHLARMLL